MSKDLCINLPLYILLVGSLYINYDNAKEIEALKNKDNYDPTLSRAILSYGLTETESTDSVIQQVQEWKKLKWGAQIGSLRSACDKDMSYVNNLVKNGDGNSLCRIAR